MSDFRLEIRQYVFEDGGDCPWAYLDKTEMFLGIVYASRKEPDGYRKTRWYVDVLIAIEQRNGHE